jgi:hexaprenyl-diphosphate synthase
MIHTASLLHDDVIDTSLTRRNASTANAEFGNKMAILAGDFLLARASVALARLRNLQVVELLATVISNLVEGEFMQLRNSSLSSSYKWSEEGWLPPGAVITKDTQRFEYYMEKTYMKTASLIAKSCRAATVLGGCSQEICDASYIYGRNLGLAFQVPRADAADR